MSKQILLGDEAVALGAIHAGISGGYSYPGTPATEIMEFILRVGRRQGVYAAWSANEKVAYEEALGMSSVGKRAIVSMKHVGLNVAADPFVNSAVTGVGGGLVVCVADDPGMHSSQNEQDSRHFAEFALIPCLEPSDQQEAYDAARAAFDLSERLGLPVMLRLTTRLAHSRADVEAREPRGQNELRPEIDWRQWTLLPGNARANYLKLVGKQPEIARESVRSPFNRLSKGGGGSGGGGERAYIVCGIAYNYFREAAGGAELPHLKIGQYPVPADLVTELVQGRREVMVIEEGYPYVESRLLGLLGTDSVKVLGKLSGHLPRTGELRPESVAAALRGEPFPAAETPQLPARPPQLCRGCSHADTFAALNEAVAGYPDAVVFSDIGCYTLGALPPYNAVSSCVDMGASISMAAGAAHAGLRPSLAVIGDSTFGHSGMTPLLGAAYRDVNIVVIICDNSTTGMTGGQLSMTTGRRLVELVRSIGVAEERVRLIEPTRGNVEANAAVIREEIEHQGLSVVIAARECIQKARKRKKGAKKKAEEKGGGSR